MGAPYQVCVSTMCDSYKHRRQNNRHRESEIVVKALTLEFMAEGDYIDKGGAYMATFAGCKRT